jgi:hypothetical protein
MGRFVAGLCEHPARRCQFGRVCPHWNHYGTLLQLSHRLTHLKYRKNRINIIDYHSNTTCPVIIQPHKSLFQRTNPPTVPSFSGSSVKTEYTILHFVVLSSVDETEDTQIKTRDTVKKVRTHLVTSIINCSLASFGAADVGSCCNTRGSHVNNCEEKRTAIERKMETTEEVESSGKSPTRPLSK